MYMNRPSEPLGSADASAQVPAKIYAVGFEFLLPYMEKHGQFVAQPEAADFILTMNNPKADWSQTMASLKGDKPIVWWTLEDPNWFETFIHQAAQADFVFTTDAACIPRYQQELGHNRVFWLPLACSPEFHFPLDLATDATDFVLSANWYHNEARLRGVQTVVDPLCKAGYSLSLFCYASFMWPARYRRYWRGETHYRTTAEQYRHGRVVLGLNNQCSGSDERKWTVMTSMRTFEALGCGKPFLAAHSDAYELLGLVHGEHMVWVQDPTETLIWAKRLLGPDGDRMACAGRELVLSRHTYAHRLSRIAEIVLSESNRS
jgi:spore maturation protein CgeB